ncbi:major facilitator superfamily domain-containing protein [Boeremia exigua]|uniref:major facilitator superfamily domain-containing protein n=1 Tax=Boeremia exigua TaxID=749465 RepID=UPI001E8DB602|nr:major facilitator superfamily domain-containing protein [Boeremia exigua]KAH6614144.1 major facilitator superfamily domain-containing protein [Boeremia exigua]
MASSSLHGVFDIQSVPPAPTYQQSKGKRPTGVLPDVELESIHGKDSFDQPATGTQTPKTPHQIEASCPPSPTQHEDAVGLVQTWNNPSMNKWRLLCCCMIYFGNGLNDAVVGALIPYMEAHYHNSHTIMSLIFIGNAVGFIAAAPLVTWVLAKLGRARTLIFAELFLIAAYVMLVCTPPFAVVIIAFLLIGYGAATSLALNNVFCANIQPSSAVLGAAHGSYGIGGTIAPIIGTALVSQGILWSRFYFVLLALRFFCVAFAAWAFRNYEEDSSATLLTALEQTASRQQAAEGPGSKARELRLALQNRVTIFGALFIFAYQGAEVALSGWIISFLINYRDGDPAKVGYVTAGFWAGITLGRFVLTHAAPRIGERNYVVGLTLGTMVLQLLAWLTPNVIGNAVAVSLLGLLLGPVYPCAQTIFSRSVPRHLQTSSIGFIGSAGSSGGAVAPFTTGILAQAVGTWVIHPVALGLYGAMLVFLFALPRMSKRTE